MQTPSATTPASPSAAGREQWKSRLGFVMAAVGSAVGLGNMWRFSYTTAAHGGAAFVVLYVLMTLLLGLPLLLAEMMLGRGARRSPIRALAHFGGPRWSILGWLFVIGAFFILAYYGVIAGWTARYAVQAVLWGFGGQDALAHFRAVATGWQAAVWQLLFMGSCVLVVRGGVRRGIELLSLVLMPLLFALVVGLAVYASTLPRAAAGYRYYLQADFSALASFEVLSAAAGQAFFSLSLGMGAMLTFASYLSDDHHLPRAASVIAGADFGVAFIAGLVVFPLVFAFDLEDTVSESSIGALFITLPQAFASLEAVGRVIAVLFFVALWVGALTSAISLLEVAVASAMDGLGWSRRQATWRIGLGSAAAGVPAALSLTVLTWMDTLVGNWLLLIGAIGLCFFVGWRMPNVASEARNGAESVRWWGLWRWLLCAAVPLLLLVLIASLVRTCSASAQKPAAASHPRLSASRAAARHARTAAKGGAAPASARPPKGPTASRCQPARSEDWGALPSPLGPIGLFVHLPRQCDPA
ncbi:MAG: sodium-dependent transporter, partial [Polyangiales bacterium]